MRRRGITATGTLIVLAVLACAGTTLYFINRQVLSYRDRSSDIKKLRSVFVATILYGNVNDELPPPNLALLQSDVAGNETFQSSGDPFTTGADFPIDPAFPNSAERSTFRISFTYLPQWVINQKLEIKDWHKAIQTPSMGLLDCYWSSPLTSTRPDGLDSSSDLLRIDIDGSVRVLDRSKSKALLDATTLFGKGGN